MKIEVSDTKTAIQDANTLLIDVKELSSVRDSLEYVLHELKDYWEQTQEDAAAFYNDLNNNIQILSEILNHNKEFANAIIDYAESQEKTSANTIN